MFMATQEKMSLLEFQNKFSTEEACRQHLFQMRWPEGFLCPKCGHERYYEIKTRHLFECTKCHYQTSVSAGTIMEKTRTELRVWFWAIYLVAHDKRGRSAISVSEELNISYKTAWLMLHKIRKAMGERDAQYMLNGIVELDDAFFGAPTEGGKRGRGTDKTPVLVGLSLSKQGYPLYLKMQVIPDVKKETVLEFAHTFIEAGATITSDAYRSYRQLAKEGFKHEAKEFNPKENPDHLKWLHTIVSNTKAFIAGTFHGLDVRHLQAYLNEFSYRFNRRHFKGELFNRLLKSCVSTPTITFTELTA